MIAARVPVFAIRTFSVPSASEQFPHWVRTKNIYFSLLWRQLIEPYYSIVIRWVSFWMNWFTCDQISFSFRISIKFYEAEIDLSVVRLKLCLMGEWFLLLCCSKFDTTLGFLRPTDHQIIRRSLHSNGKKISFEHRAAWMRRRISKHGFWLQHTQTTW